MNFKLTIFIIFCSFLVFGQIPIEEREQARSPKYTLSSGFEVQLTKKIFTRNNENIIPVAMVANQQGITPDITL